MDEPTIESRPGWVYVSLRQDVTMTGLGKSIQDGIERVAKYLAAHGLRPSGPPFVRYVFINMMEKLTVETGFPLDEVHAPRDTLLAAGAFPSGDYVCARHVGPPESLITANAELQHWAATKGVTLDVRREGGGEYWAARFERMLIGPATERSPEKWVTELAYRTAS
jgi:effector-binding domain-containing protein